MKQLLPLLSVAEVAKRLGVSTRTVYRYLHLKKGRLNGHKLADKTWRIDPADLEEFIEGKGETA